MMTMTSKSASELFAAAALAAAYLHRPLSIAADGHDADAATRSPLPCRRHFSARQRFTLLGIRKVPLALGSLPPVQVVMLLSSPCLFATTSATSFATATRKRQPPATPRQVMKPAGRGRHRKICARDDMRARRPRHYALG